MPNKESNPILNDRIDADYEDIDDSHISFYNETLIQRLFALRDIFFHFHYSMIANHAASITKRLLTNSSKFIGNLAWIITTSTMLLGLPILYAFDREKSSLEFEKEQSKFDKKQ